jgi:5'-methylthioadenosine phosphorylase
MSKIGLILGHGLNLIDKISGSKDHFMNTPYGKPSAKFITGKIDDKEVVVMQRHGSKDDIPAFMVNYKANISVFREMGCTHILASSVCGSLQEEIMVGEFVVFDQFIDLTTHRELTYTDKLSFDQLNLSAFNKPFSDEIRDALIESSVVLGFTIHTKGTVLAVDGPRQSTRAESNLFRKWGADVVNTTTAPEAILSHELGIQYAALSLCTYYDTWRTDIEPATRAEKQEIIKANSNKMKLIALTALSKL